jgi:hypothetical protein
MNKLLLVAGGSTLVYACLAVLMGVLPGIELSKTPPGSGVEPLTALQAEGRDIYVANGCSYCHTQQVRPLPQDKIFGRPSAPGDFAYQTPELLGSQRTGPDLTNVSARQPSSVWHYIHLYNPRAVVPDSIMPAFEWMFKVVDQAPTGVTPVPLPAGYAPAHGVVVPDHRAEALIAYLLSLKQPALPGSRDVEGDAAMPGVSNATGAGGPIPASGPNAAAGSPATGAAAPAASGGYDPTKPMAKDYPARSLHSRATLRSTTVTPMPISTPYCTVCKAPRSLASHTRARCLHSGARSATSTLPTSSIMSGVPGATMASWSRPLKWPPGAPKASDRRRQWSII